MGTKFSYFFKEIEQEAKQTGTEEEFCLIRKFFAEERKKAMHLRKNYCHISCSCSRCNPGML